MRLYLTLYLNFIKKKFDLNYIIFILSIVSLSFYILKYKITIKS